MKKRERAAGSEKGKLYESAPPSCHFTQDFGVFFCALFNAIIVEPPLVLILIKKEELRMNIALISLWLVVILVLLPAEKENAKRHLVGFYLCHANDLYLLMQAKGLL